MLYQTQTYNPSAFFIKTCAGQPESGKKIVQTFTSVDPLADKYPGISGYAYCMNNPLKYVDPDGRAPGDLFKTKDQAASDFGFYYNGASILSGLEYGSSIYQVNVNGKTHYTYTAPAIGTDRQVKESNPPNGVKKEAIVHSHGNYIKGMDNNGISPGDKWESYNKNIDNYVCTPDGSLKKYDPYVGETLIHDKLPSDPKDPERKNNITPIDVPKQKQQEILQKNQTKEKTI